MDGMYTQHSETFRKISHELIIRNNLENDKELNDFKKRRKGYNKTLTSTN